MEEESFEHRVQRLFGAALLSSVPNPKASSSPAASWSVAAGAVERREWNRSSAAADDCVDREDIPCSSAFYEDGGCLSRRGDRRRDSRKKEFEGEFDDLDGEEGGDDRGDGGGEERDVRAAVGLDPTLDNEDEEDEFDRVAVCREDAGERVYMRDIKDHGSFLNCRSVIPDLYEDSLEEVHVLRKDPRADHFAASVRLTEDKKGVGSFPGKDISVDLRAKVPEVDANLKPILKRKESQISSKPNKRVRFDSACQDVHSATFEEPQDFHTVPESMEATKAEDEDPLAPVGSSEVPDYLRNPSKYTRYTFDSLDDDDKINKCAFDDFRNLVKKSNPELQTDFPMELPKTVTFMPRKKACDAMPIDDKSESAQEASLKESGLLLNSSTINIAEEASNSEACEMEEDDVQTPMAEAAFISKKGRRYRAKPNPENSP